MKMVFAGSFAPVTKGHLDIIQRASVLADTLIVAVTHNVNKPQYIKIEDRINLISEAVKDIKNVKVMAFDTLLADFCKEVKADCIIKSIRDTVDFAYEEQMAAANKQTGDTETVFLFASPQYKHISSSLVRELISYGADITPFVPEGLAQKIIKVTKCL
jgi:pantetheine-phosphate adenylyltransferase